MTGSERGRVFNGPWRKHLVGSCRSGKDRRIGNGQEKENDEKIDRSKTPTDDLSVNLLSVRLVIFGVLIFPALLSRVRSLIWRHIDSWGRYGCKSVLENRDDYRKRGAATLEGSYSYCKLKTLDGHFLI